jgi:hypothetical protein
MSERAALPLSRSSWLVVALAAAAVACAKGRDERANAGERNGTDAMAGVAVEKETPKGAADAGGAAAIVVNRVALSEETVRQLQQIYPVPIAPGRYWYDAVSGAYGREGEPVAGQMMPGLSLGGPLAADASRGTSGVFINGRNLTAGEKVYLERLCQTPVAPGRYWIMANGLGGFEGGPAFFNLGQCPGVAQQGGGSRSSTRTYCDANGACTSSGILGSITTAPY